MPTFEKLANDEVEMLKKRRSARQDLSEYLTFLDTLKSGEWGALTLGEGESARAIKRRLTLASKQKGIELKYKRGEEGRIIFEVK